MIRIFDVQRGIKLFSFKRGLLGAEIFSIAFSLSSTYLAVSTSQGILYIFKVKFSDEKAIESAITEIKDKQDEAAKSCGLFAGISYLVKKIAYKSLGKNVDEQNVQGPNISLHKDELRIWNICGFDEQNEKGELKKIFTYNKKGCYQEYSYDISSNSFTYIKNSIKYTRSLDILSP